MTSKVDLDKLEKLFSKISYHRAAEGRQYFKEIAKERETLAAIKEMFQGLSDDEIRAAFHGANGMRYLVMEYEFVSSSDTGVS